MSKIVCQWRENNNRYMVNPDGQVFMKNRETDEWLKQNQKSTREFIRKWGHFCKHDSLMKPIVPPKYDVGIRINNCSDQLLEVLEPWCNVIYTDADIDRYISSEQEKTNFNNLEKDAKKLQLTLENL